MSESQRISCGEHLSSSLLDRWSHIGVIERSQKEKAFGLIHRTRALKSFFARIDKRHDRFTSRGMLSAFNRSPTFAMRAALPWSTQSWGDLDLIILRMFPDLAPELEEEEIITNAWSGQKTSATSKPYRSAWLSKPHAPARVSRGNYVKGVSRIPRLSRSPVRALMPPNYGNKAGGSTADFPQHYQSRNFASSQSSLSSSITTDQLPKRSGSLPMNRFASTNELPQESKDERGFGQQKMTSIPSAGQDSPSLIQDFSSGQQTPDRPKLKANPLSRAADRVSRGLALQSKTWEAISELPPFLSRSTAIYKAISAVQPYRRSSSSPSGSIISKIIHDKLPDTRVDQALNPIELAESRFASKQGRVRGLRPVMSQSPAMQQLSVLPIQEEGVQQGGHHAIDVQSPKKSPWLSPKSTVSTQKQISGAVERYAVESDSTQRSTVQPTALKATIKPPNPLSAHMMSRSVVFGHAPIRQDTLLPPVTSFSKRHLAALSPVNSTRSPVNSTRSPVNSTRPFENIDDQMAGRDPSLAMATKLPPSSKAQLTAEPSVESTPSPMSNAVMRDVQTQTAKSAEALYQRSTFQAEQLERRLDADSFFEQSERMRRPMNEGSQKAMRLSTPEQTPIQFESETMDTSAPGEKTPEQKLSPWLSRPKVDLSQPIVQKEIRRAVAHQIKSQRLQPSLQPSNLSGTASAKTAKPMIRALHRSKSQPGDSVYSSPVALKPLESLQRIRPVKRAVERRVEPNSDNPTRSRVVGAASLLSSLSEKKKVALRTVSTLPMLEGRNPKIGRATERSVDIRYRRPSPVAYASSPQMMSLSIPFRDSDTGNTVNQSSSPWMSPSTPGSSLSMPNVQQAAESQALLREGRRLSPPISRMMQRMDAPDLMPEWISVGSGDSMFSQSRAWRLSPKPSPLSGQAPFAQPLQFQTSQLESSAPDDLMETSRRSPWLSRPKNASPEEALETLSRLGVKPKTIRTSTGLYVDAVEAKKMGVTIPRTVPGRKLPLHWVLEAVDLKSINRALPTWAKRASEKPLVRGSEDFIRALVGTTSVDDVIRVVFERGNTDAPAMKRLPKEAARVITQIRQEAHSVQTQRTELMEEADVLKRTGEKRRRSARVVSGFTGLRPIATAQTEAQQARTDKVVALAKRLEDLVLIAETQSKKEAQMGARMAEDSHDAIEEGQSVPKAETDKADSSADIDALYRDVLSAVEGMLNMRRFLRPDNTDQFDGGW